MPDRSNEEEATQGAAKGGDPHKQLESGDLDAIFGCLETYRTVTSRIACQKDLKECAWGHSQASKLEAARGEGGIEGNIRIAQY